MDITQTPAADELRQLPATTDVVTAGAYFGLGRQAAYRLARRGEFPVPVMKLGGRLRVVTADLRHALGVDH